MWIINFKTFLKHLLNNKLYAVITVLGFAVSLAFVILLSAYVKNELTINSKQLNKDRIYRLTTEKFGNFAPPVGPWVQREIPEVENFCRTKELEGLVDIEDGKKIEVEFLLVDSTFFNIFTFDLLAGDKNAALQTKNSVVVSQEFSNKLFGNDSPLGKEIILDTNIPCIITGIIEDVSKVSSFKNHDLFINFKLLQDIWHWDKMENDFGNCSFDLYFLERKNSNLPSKGPQMLKMFQEDFWLFKNGRNKEVRFETLDEAHYSKFWASGMQINSKILVKVLFAIVILILFLAIINYLNLTIAQSGARAKDIAIRKLVGSSRLNLIRQYVFESIILILIAFSIAIFLSFLFEDIFDNLLKTKVRLKDSFTLSALLISTLFIILVGFISGIIPAITITKLKIVEVIKGGFRRKSKAVYSRILIGFQYVVVIVLIVATIVISRQAKYMLNKDLGFDKTNIIQMPFYFLDNNKNESLKSELLKVPGVKDVSFVSGSPSDGGNNNSFVYKEKPVSFQVFKVDSSFFGMLDIEIQPTGVAYSKKGIWLNRTAIRNMELDSIPISFIDLPVLGIINNLHFRSLEQEIGNLMVFQLDTAARPWDVIVKIDGSNIFETTNRVKETYSKFVEGVPIEIEFFDESISKWYDSEKRMESIIRYFALLSIIISVMGIFAMSIFYNQQKIKEIGVRKVNGATIFEIITMLNKDFIKWVLIAFIIAIPIAYYVMSKWLENFAYKIELSWWIFAIAGLIAIIIALLTVSWNTYIAARRNPIEALRYE